jgi:hypothetical protein
MQALLDVGYLETVPPVEDTFDSGPYDALGTAE